uniref:Uncharacterized protein n=1 Tax=Alsidium seaforthii TaxID=2007182 RepID=A0A1Z1MDQ2_9FLOR|nr:hypothetical protein [Bryothamnion seaforthii]ARW63945.1 hypothetical protein [Bryothamnion seaforthii]
MYTIKNNLRCTKSYFLYIKMKFAINFIRYKLNFSLCISRI